MNEKLKKMKEKSQKLNKMINTSRDMKFTSGGKIAKDKIPQLEDEILETYKELWQDILEICRNENIKNMSKFDEKYPVLKNDLYGFVLGYTDFTDECVQTDESFVEFEIKLLQEVIEQFKLDKTDKEDFELTIIRDKYYIR